MADTMEAIRQSMLEKPSDEFTGVERHELGFAVMAIILPAEGNRLLGDVGDPGVCDGHPVGIAAQIGEDLGWSTEGRFGVDHPFDLTQRPQFCGEGMRFSKTAQIAEEIKLASLECTTQCVEK